MLLVLSSAYKAGDASGLTIERALRIIHLSTILAAVGSLDILTGVSVRNRPPPLLTIVGLTLSNLRDVITGILRALELISNLFTCSGGSAFSLNHTMIEPLGL